MQVGSAGRVICSLLVRWQQGTGKQVRSVRARRHGRRSGRGHAHGASSVARLPGFDPGPWRCDPVSRRVCSFGFAPGTSGSTRHPAPSLTDPLCTRGSLVPGTVTPGATSAPTAARTRLGPAADGAPDGGSGRGSVGRGRLGDGAPTLGSVAPRRSSRASRMSAGRCLWVSPWVRSGSAWLLRQVTDVTTGYVGTTALSAGILAALGWGTDTGLPSRISSRASWRHRASRLRDRSRWDCSCSSASGSVSGRARRHRPLERSAGGRLWSRDAVPGRHRLGRWDAGGPAPVRAAAVAVGGERWVAGGRDPGPLVSRHADASRSSPWCSRRAC